LIFKNEPHGVFFGNHYVDEKGDDLFTVMLGGSMGDADVSFWCQGIYSLLVTHVELFTPGALHIDDFDFSLSPYLYERFENIDNFVEFLKALFDDAKCPLNGKADLRPFLQKRSVGINLNTRDGTMFPPEEKLRSAILLADELVVSEKAIQLRKWNSFICKVLSYTERSNFDLRLATRFARDEFTQAHASIAKRFPSLLDVLDKTFSGDRPFLNALIEHFLDFIISMTETSPGFGTSDKRVQVPYNVACDASAADVGFIVQFHDRSSADSLRLDFPLPEKLVAISVVQMRDPSRSSTVREAYGLQKVLRELVHRGLLSSGQKLTVMTDSTALMWGVFRGTSKSVYLLPILQDILTFCADRDIFLDVRWHPRNVPFASWADMQSKRINLKYPPSPRYWFANSFLSELLAELNLKSVIRASYSKLICGKYSFHKSASLHLFCLPRILTTRDLLDIVTILLSRPFETIMLVMPEFFFPGFSDLLPFLCAEPIEAGTWDRSVFICESRMQDFNALFLCFNGKDCKPI